MLAHDRHRMVRVETVATDAGDDLNTTPITAHQVEVVMGNLARQARARTPA